MNVLIVGNGAREFSIGLAVKKSKKLNKLYFAPGNGATNRVGENIDITDYEGLASFAKKNSIDLTIVGEVCSSFNGVKLERNDGTIIDIKSKGYNHFR